MRRLAAEAVAGCVTRARGVVRERGRSRVAVRVGRFPPPAGVAREARALIVAARAER